MLLMSRITRRHHVTLLELDPSEHISFHEIHACHFARTRPDVLFVKSIHVLSDGENVLSCLSVIQNGHGTVSAVLFYHTIISHIMFLDVLFHHTIISHNYAFRPGPFFCQLAPRTTVDSGIRMRVYVREYKCHLPNSAG